MTIKVIMTTYTGGNYNSDASENNPDSLEYDLDWEKQRIAKGTEMIKKELLKKWQEKNKNARIFPDSISGLNPAVIEFLLSFKNTLLYNDIAEKFNLNDEQRNTLPKIIWRTSMDKSWDQIENIIKDKFKIDFDATTITNILNQNIITQVREMSMGSFSSHTAFRKQAQPSEVKTVNLSLSQALTNFSRLGDQTVSSDKIKVKGYSESVRPTIKNWIADYTTTLGYRKHSSIERSDYLYKGTNASYLSDEERQKLSQILKSFDEKTPLTVKTKDQIVIFSDGAPTQEGVYSPPEPTQPIYRSKEEDSPQTQNSFNEKLPSRDSNNAREQYQGLSFSSPQKMPYEKNPENNIRESTNTVNLKNINLDKRPATSQHNIVNLKELNQ